MFIDKTETFLVIYLVENNPISQHVFPGHFSVENNLHSIDDLINRMREDYCNEFILDREEIRLKDGSQLKRIS